MSATYILDRVSPRAGPSPLAPPTIQQGIPSDLPGEQRTNPTGHSEAIWVSRWGTTHDGRSFAATAGLDHTIKIWDPRNVEAPRRTIASPSSMGICGLDLDRAPSGSTFLIANSLDSVVSRYALDGTLQGQKEYDESKTWSISTHPSSEIFATGGSEGKMMVCSSAPDEGFGTVLSTLDSRAGFALATNFSEDGRWLGSVGNSGYVSLFDVETGTLRSSFAAHSTVTRTLAFTSSLLITGSDDSRINIFDLRALTAPSSGGTSLGGGGQTSRKGEVASLAGHVGWVVSLATRRDRILASGGSGGTIQLWDLASPSQPFATLRDHVGDVWSLAWAPDVPGAGSAVEGVGGATAVLGGGQLLSAGEDGVVRWWRAGGG